MSSSTTLAGTEGEPLIIFDVNPLHNVLHLASALVLLGAGLSQDKNVRGDAPVVPGV